MRRPRWRLMTWVIIIWIALTLIAAFSFAAQDQTCTDQVGLERIQCHLEARAGFRGAVFWLVAGTIVLGIVWVVTQPRQRRARECPACGQDVPRGETVCRHCGHDFAAAARGQAAPPPVQPPPPAPPPPQPPPPRVENDE